MNADAFRHFYDYHFAENGRLWDSYVTALSPEQFTQDVDYSHGSVRDQVVHIMNVDEVWFSRLPGVEIADPLDPEQLDDRESIRARWDRVERSMRAYLDALRDDMLLDRPLEGSEHVFCPPPLPLLYYRPDHNHIP